MNDATLRADCARCAALCCVAFALEASEAFAIDKPAHQPCPRLDTAGGCSIHARRREEGFSGCIAYDCLGAGQRVVQELFGGATWLDDPSLLAPMLRAFEAVAQAHRLLALLALARTFDLPARAIARIDSLIGRLDTAAAHTGRPSAARTIDALEAQVRTLLASLRLRRPDAAQALSGAMPQQLATG